ncbi:hypothetical protein BDQ17DRAFT_1242035 [Cyathus striatus]|nr:hypothetical protein BDQ17DRAFT_1242035 [Cyathus striatus]
MAQYSAEEIGFIDETSKDEHTVGRRYGRAGKEQQAMKSHPFVHGRCTSTEALLTLDGIVAWTVAEGSMTKVLFLDWLEHDIVSSVVQ